MTKSEKAVDYFRKNYNCAQSVLTAFGPDYGLSEDFCMKVACAFGGGMGRQQYTCGAVTGALMVLGLKYGKGLNNPEEKKRHTYSLTKKFISEFIRINGSSNCRELLEGLDMNNEDDLKVIKEKNLFETKCEKFVADAVDILEKILK
ncbi:MAG TPA: C-GCAxxG-C-C family protein [Bacteroidales bacterium]|nr:C-GCAxxG-C-C family protein [Bacteroidales bacterium]